MGKRGKRGEGRKASGGTGRENLTTSPNYLTSPLLSAQNYPADKKLLSSHTCWNCVSITFYALLHPTTLLFNKEPYLSDASILGSSSYNVSGSRLREMTCCHRIS